MPHINRVRLVNVGFNDAKSFFEDLRLSLAGKSTTYDLENGGGKSVLLMMLLQTVIPNTSLRDDKPLKNIFIGGKDRTSHVLVEWILDEGERYKYMLTGFCARRKRNQNEVRQPVLDGYNIEQDEDTISEGIDYYNYVIFYDKPVEYDIYSLELVREEQSGKIYIGYDELRSELNRLKQRGYPVNIKDGKREYMEYISMYNLISTEWKIIREMNSGENSIEKYFRENKTSRRLIEKLLLPIIDDTERVQQSGKLEGDGNIQLADTLIEIRENLARLMKDREHLEEYNQILLFYNKMLEICNRMEKDFQYEEKLKKQAVEIRNLLAKKLDEKKKEKAELEADLTEKTFNNRKTEHEKKLLDIQLLEFDEGLLKVEHEEVKAQQVRLEDERREQEDKYKTAGAEKEYLQYKEERLKRRKAETGLKTLFQSQNELDKEYNEAGSAYRTALVHQQNELEGMSSKAAKQKEGIQLDGDCIDQKISEVSRLIGIAEGDESSTSARIAELDKKAKPLSEYFSELGRVDVLLDLSSYLDTSEKELERLEDNKKEIETALLDIRQRGQDVKSQITQNSQDIEKIKWQLTPHVEFFEKYAEEKLKLDKKSSFYDCEDFMQWRSRLVELIHGNKETYFRNRVEKDVLSRKLEVLETYGFYIPNEEILALSDKLKGNSTFTQTGIEWLNQMGKTQQEELLKRAPLLPYSVLVDHEAFQRIKDGKLDFGGFISDYPVPIIDFDFIRGQETLGRGDVISPEIDKNLILSKDALNQYIDELKRDIKRVQESMITLEESAQTYDEDINALTVFEEDYSSEKIASHERTLKKLEDEILNLENKGKSLTDQLNELQKFEKDLST
ncbi:MAG: hypothetical protein GX783_06690, partial [Clostridiales bacterium]|nr:hypothetical protein [Clostridiales bacterium]